MKLNDLIYGNFMIQGNVRIIKMTQDLDEVVLGEFPNCSDLGDAVACYKDCWRNRNLSIRHMGVSKRDGYLNIELCEE